MFKIKCKNVKNISIKILEKKRNELLMIFMFYTKSHVIHMRIFMAIRWEIDKFDYTCCNSMSCTCDVALILSKHKGSYDFLLDELYSSKKRKKRSAAK